MNFDLNINVQIGVTPQLATFLTALLQNSCPATVQLPAIEAPAAPTEAAEEVPEPETPAAPKPFAEAPVQPPEKELTEEDIRAAMHRTRQRFEGEDYKENTDSEAYKKYHKQLTSMFKQIAAVLGADKPSALPADRRAAFIAECDALIIGDDGNVTPPQHHTK